MIIRYDISILRDDYSRTKTYTRLRLYLTLLSASITKKEIDRMLAIAERCMREFETKMDALLAKEA